MQVSVVVVVAVTIITVVAVHAASKSSYGDGYAWGGAETVGVISKTAPSCSYSEMASNGPVVDSNFVYNKPEGANEPNDNYAEWEAGCEAGARNTIKEFNSP